jgi:hypothetical protein
MKMMLPGLEQLLDTCGRLRLSLETKPPEENPPAPGTLMEGHPFAPREAGLILDGTSELAEKNREWQESWQEQLALPLFVFGGEPLLAHHYAMVPGLANEQGVQPVVRVNTHEEPFALPISSSVDRLFTLYSRYLEALVATPGHEDEGSAVLLFPWDVPWLLASDERLVELIRAGRFDPIMKKDGSTVEWLSQLGCKRPP